MKTDELKRKPKNNHMLSALLKTIDVKRLQQQQQNKKNENRHRKTSYRKNYFNNRNCSTYTDNPTKYIEVLCNSKKILTS